VAAGNLQSSLGHAVGALVDRVIGTQAPQGPFPMPFRPEGRKDMPGRAWGELEATCGELNVERMLVLPRFGTRPTFRRRVWAPARVLAVGSLAIGVWTDEGDAPDRLEYLPLADVLAIDDRTVLLDGRLSVVGPASRVVVGYNTTARTQLRESIAWLRRAVAGSAVPVQETFVWMAASDARRDRPRSELPHKWAYILNQRDDLRIDPVGQEMVAVGDVAEIGHSRGPATGVALLGPRELVIAAEPSEWLELSRYGVDLTVVPRSRLSGIGWSRGEVTIQLQRDATPTTPNGPTATTPTATIRRPLDEQLYGAMRVAFGEAVHFLEPTAASTRVWGRRREITG
jgi:hypothetical protein